MSKEVFQSLKKIIIKIILEFKNIIIGYKNPKPR